ncbi:MAG: HAD family hydrolase [Clostridia bacterium]
MIKNIILDIGGVLIEYNDEAYLEKMGITQKERKRNIQQAIFHNPAWKACLNGKITTQTFLKEVVKGAKEEEEVIYKLFSKEAMPMLMPIKEKMKKQVQMWQNAGLKVYLLSNVIMDTYLYERDELKLLELVDGGVFSCIEQVSKPEKEIYLRLLEKYHLLPQECIFVDDQRKNLVSAKELNMKTVVFENEEQVKKQIEKEIGKHE